MKRRKNKSTNKPFIKNSEKEEKILNKNIIITLIILLIALVLLFLIFKNLPITNKVIEKPYSPPNCSNESIKKAWESIFRGSSENITILTAPKLNESNSSFGIFFIGGCPLYSVYKANGTRLEALVGVDMWFLMDINMIYAINGEFKPGKMDEIILSLKNDSENYKNILSITLAGFDENNETNPLLPRNISTIQEAKLQFESIFNISSSNWTKENLTEDYESSNVTVYSFNESEEMENITAFGESINPLGVIGKAGLIFGNSSIDEYIFTKTSIFGMLKDIEEKYGNWTSPINTSQKNITIEVNNSRLRMSEELSNIFAEPRSGKQKIKILENNKTIVETEFNFTDNFDWTQIILKKQDNSSNRGYVIINGLNSTKNITVDRLNNNSDSVCIKDKEINNINEISTGCNLSDEYLLKCPGNISNFTCTISVDKFMVTGLTHSAIIEFTSIPKQCTPSWQCNDWTNYEKSCGYRTCIDMNNCRNDSTKPNETQTCPVCIPNWECTNFLPEKCPKEKVKTRTCTDSNNCKTSQGEPSLKQSCKIETNWTLIIAVILGGIILLIAGILLIKGKNNTEIKNINEEQSYPQSNNQSPNSPSDYSQ